MKKEMFLAFPIWIILIITVPVAFSDEYEDEFEDDDREGFGIMEREREREHQDDAELTIGSDTGNMILYGTITAIAVSVVYTGFKLYRTKSKVSKR